MKGFILVDSKAFFIEDSDIENILNEIQNLVSKIRRENSELYITIYKSTFGLEKVGNDVAVEILREKFGDIPAVHVDYKSLLETVKIKYQKQKQNVLEVVISYMNNSEFNYEFVKHWKIL